MATVEGTFFQALAIPGPSPNETPWLTIAARPALSIAPTVPPKWVMARS